MYYTRTYNEEATYAAMPWEGWRYEKLVTQRAYDLDHQFSYTPEGTFPIELEQKIIEEGACVLNTNLQFYSTYGMQARERWGYDPFRISKNPARMYDTNSGMPIQKNTILKEVFEPQLWALRSGGIPDYFLDKVWIEETLDEPLEPIDVRHLLLPLGILTAGILIAVAVFLKEFYLPPGKCCNPTRVNAPMIVLEIKAKDEVKRQPKSFESPKVQENIRKLPTRQTSVISESSEEIKE